MELKMRRCHFSQAAVFVLTNISPTVTKWSPLMTALKLLKYTGLHTNCFTVFSPRLLFFLLSLSSTHTQIYNQSLLHLPVRLSITRDVSLMDWG